MLDLLYETALEKKDEINHKAREINENIGVDASEWWVNHPIHESSKDMNIAAGDGSINKRNYLPFIFYAIGAETILHTPQGNKRVKSSEIDIITHHKYVEDRIRNYMGILEIKNALKLFKEQQVDLFLFDGSILGNLIRPLPIEKQLKDEDKTIITAKFVWKLLDGIYSELQHQQNPGIVSFKLSQMVGEVFGENSTDAMIYLESLENLLAIAEFLKNKKNLVAISKTSTSDKYFNKKIPDIAIFDMHSKKQGYSKPRYVEGKKIKREFPVRDDFFHSLTFTIFYARLDDYKNILKFELPYHATEEDIQKILSDIKKISAEGYPLLLKMAHNDVVIRRNDMENLSKIIGLRAKQGREMLNG